MAKKKTVKKKKQQNCSACGKISTNLVDGKCSFCNDFVAEPKKPKLKLPALTKEQKKKQEEFEEQVLAIRALQRDPKWKHYEDAVVSLMMEYNKELLSDEFTELDPLAKDKRHAAIVLVSKVLAQLLTLGEESKLRKLVNAEEHLVIEAYEKLKEGK